MAWSWSDIGKAAGDFAYDITGADNYMQAYRDAKKGNWGGAIFNLAQGLGETGLLVAPALGSSSALARGVASAPKAVRGAAWIAGIGGEGGIIPVIRGIGSAAAANAGLGAVANYFGRGTPVGAAAPGGFGFAEQQRMQRMKPAVGGQSFDYAEQQRMQRMSPGTGGAGGKGGGTTKPAGTTVAPVVTPTLPATLPAISPGEAAMLDELRRQAFAANQRELANIATEGTQLSLGTAGARRTAGRRARGGMLDLASQLAESGYMGSPAQLGIGQEAIRQAQAAQLSDIAGQYAAGRSQLGQRAAASEQAMLEAMNRLAAQETLARTQASFRGLQNIYGGR